MDLMLDESWDYFRQIAPPKIDSPEAETLDEKVDKDKGLLKNLRESKAGKYVTTAVAAIGLGYAINTAQLNFNSSVPKIEHASVQAGENSPAAKHVIDMYEWDGTYTKKGQDFPGKNEWSREIPLNKWEKMYKKQTVKKIFKNPDIFEKIMDRLYDGILENDEISKVQLTSNSIFFRIACKDKKYILLPNNLLSKYQYPDGTAIYGIWENIDSFNRKKIEGIYKNL